jgi:hypothetical protein
MRKEPDIHIEKPSLLVVEGKDEELFFGALRKHLGLQNLQILGIGGKTNLRTNLEALTRTHDFGSVLRLGVVRDANDEPGAAFQSVCGALKAAGLPVPTSPLESAGDCPRVAVMIVPGSGETGKMEDICLAAVAQDPAIPCVEQYFECLKEKLKKDDLPEDFSKARIHAFLASRHKPDLRLGEAAQTGYLPWDHEAFQPAKDLLKMVAGT